MRGLLISAPLSNSIIIRRTPARALHRESQVLYLRPADDELKLDIRIGETNARIAGTRARLYFFHSRPESRSRCWTG